MSVVGEGLRVRVEGGRLMLARHAYRANEIDGITRHTTCSFDLFEAQNLIDKLKLAS